MAVRELPSHPEVQQAIDALALSVDASELHGSLCGLLCGGARSGRREWLTQLALEPERAPPADGALDRLFLGSQEQLADPGMGFQLLMPDDEASMAARGEALLGWCRGFLGGFGLAPRGGRPLSADADEALQDLSRIAASELSYEESEADEEALAEVAEFVRVAALLLHGEGRQPAEPGAGAGRLH